MECRMREIVAEGVGLREMGAFEAASETAGARGEVFGTMRQGAARWSETVDARVPECGKTAGIMARGPHRALDVALFFFTPEDSARGRGFAPETRVSRALGAAKAGLWAIVAVLSVIAFAS